MRKTIGYLFMCLMLSMLLGGCTSPAKEGSNSMKSTIEESTSSTSSENNNTANNTSEEGKTENPTENGNAAENTSGNPPESSQPVEIITIESAALQAPVYGEQDAQAITAARGANEFAFRLSAELIKKAEDESFVCSPYSAWLPLAALANATDIGHRDTLLTALNAAGLTPADLNRAASRMLYDLTGQREQEFMAEHAEDAGGQFHNPLKIANAVFVRRDLSLRNEFARSFGDFYRGTVMSVDFASDDAVTAVNQWASENTEGLITDIVQDFGRGTVAAIANAIYFSDRFEREFDAAQTTTGTFHAPSGDTEAFFMLREGDGQTYYEDDKVQALPLRFTTGGSLYIILPKSGGAADLLAGMTADYFAQIQNDSTPATGKLLLPRFTIESDLGDFRSELEALGIPLFDRNAAPLTGGLVTEEFPVWLSEALQKAVIKVDEKGTTAAAVTLMTARSTGISVPTEPFEMICDRPFIFVLCGNTYDGGDQVLFTGVANQPQP